MGIPGVGPDQYLALLVNEGLPLDPDLVLCSFFVGNDLSDEYPQDPLAFSYVLSFFRNLYVTVRGVEGPVLLLPPDYDDAQPTFARKQYLDIEHGRARIFDPQFPHFRTMLNRSVKALSRMNEIAAARGIQFVVVLVPDEMQVDDGLQAKVRRRFGPAGGSFDFALPNRELVGELARSGIQTIDLLDDFRSAEPTRRLYRLNDSHWNIAGNDLAASVITGKLMGRPSLARGG
jgi:hypothetical protein